MFRNSKLIRTIVAAAAALTLLASLAPAALADGSSDSTLTAISLSGSAALSPVFNPSQLTYSVLVPNATDSVSVTPTAADGAAFTINGVSEPSHTYTLAINTPVACSIVVTAQDGSAQTAYTVTITRVGPARLVSLACSAGALVPAFDPLNTGSRANPYVLTLPENTPLVTFTPVASNPADKIFINDHRLTGTSFTVSAKNGQTKSFTIVTLSPGGITRSYFFQVKRDPSTDANLNKLKINIASATLTPAFDPSVLSYTLTVPENRKSFVVSAKANSPYATVTINGKRCASREIKISNGAFPDVAVVVKAQAGNTTTYTVHFSQAPRIVSFTACRSHSGDHSTLPITFKYKLQSPSDKTVLEINVGGNWQPLLTRADGAGWQTYQWDGKIAGAAVPAGTYQVRLSASNGGLDATPRIISVDVK